MKLKLTSLILLIFAFNNVVLAQNDAIETFKLVKQKSEHYFFDAQVNNSVDATFFLESAIDWMLIDSLFAFNNQERLGIEFTPNDTIQKLSLGGQSNIITHKARAKIAIGNSIFFSGEIFVLPNLKKRYDIAIPIQNLYNNIDNEKCFLKLDLSGNSLQVINRDKLELELEDSQYDKIRINYDTYHKMPAIKTELRFNERKKTRVLNGNFNLDMGNASFLYLFDQSKFVQSFFRVNSRIKLLDAYDKKGRMIAKAFVVKEGFLADIKFNDKAIAITKMLPKFTTDGSIGLKFFEQTVSIFDFAKSMLYVKYKQ